MIGDYQAWEPAFDVPEPYDGHLLADQDMDEMFVRRSPNHTNGVLTAEFLSHDGPHDPLGLFNEAHQPPPPGELGALLHGLHRPMPHLPVT